MKRLTYEEIMDQTVILRDRFNNTFRELEGMTNDPSLVATARAKAGHL
jgi:hypothetical protein